MVTLENFPTENFKLNALWDQDRINFGLDFKQQGEENAARKACEAVEETRKWHPIALARAEAQVQLVKCWRGQKRRHSDYWLLWKCYRKNQAEIIRQRWSWRLRGRGRWVWAVGGAGKLNKYYKS